MKLMLFRLTILVIISLSVFCCAEEKKEGLKTSPVVDFIILNNSLDSIAKYILVTERSDFDYDKDTLFVRYKNIEPKNFLERCDRVVFGDDFNVNYYSRFKNTRIYKEKTIDRTKKILSIFKVCKFESYYKVIVGMSLGSKSLHYGYFWDREENNLISKELNSVIIE